MLTDALFDAADRIQYYITSPDFARAYRSEIREKAWAIIEAMDRLRLQKCVDCPPGTPPVSDKIMRTCNRAGAGWDVVILASPQAHKAFVPISYPNRP